MYNDDDDDDDDDFACFFPSLHERMPEFLCRVVQPERMLRYILDF